MTWRDELKTQVQDNYPHYEGETQKRLYEKAVFIRGAMQRGIARELAEKRNLVGDVVFIRVRPDSHINPFFIERGWDRKVFTAMGRSTKRPYKLDPVAHGEKVSAAMQSWATERGEAGDRMLTVPRSISLKDWRAGMMQAALKAAEEGENRPTGD